MEQQQAIQPGAHPSLDDPLERIVGSAQLREHDAPTPSAWALLVYWLKPAVLGIGVGLGVALFFDLTDRFGSSRLALEHLATIARCEDAEKLGHAPAREGEPGYWPHLDPDGNGIACE